MWTVPWAAGEEIGRTLRNTRTVYYCAEKLRVRVNALQWPWAHGRANIPLLSSPREDAKDEQRTSNECKRRFPRPSVWHSQPPPATVIIERREAVCACRYSGEESGSEKSVGVSWPESCCSTTLHLIPVAQLHLEVCWPWQWTAAKALRHRGSSSHLLVRKSYLWQNQRWPNAFCWFLSNSEVHQPSTGGNISGIY